MGKTVLRGLLAAMRLWYRLTRLFVEGSPPRAVRAELNPSGVANRLSEVEKNRLLADLREEVQAEGADTGVQEQARGVTTQRITAEGVDPSAWNAVKAKPPSDRISPQKNPILLVVVPGGTSSFAAATGFSQALSEELRREGRLPTRRIYLFDEIPFLANRAAASDPVGLMAPLVEHLSGNFVVPEGIQDTYAGMGGSVQNSKIRKDTLGAARQWKSGEYRKVAQLDPQVSLNVAVPLTAELVRGAYPAVTGPAGFKAAQRWEDAVAAGATPPPGSKPLEQMYRELPYGGRGAVGAGLQMSYLERQQANALESGEKRPRPQWGRGRQTPEQLRDDIVEHMVQMLLLEDLVTEEGLETLTYEQLRRKLREMMRDPAWRRDVF